MKHRITYSLFEQLYKIESKRFFGKWETRKNYFYTDNTGNIINVRGFNSYMSAEEWLNDRYPICNTNESINKNIAAEF